MALTTFDGALLLVSHDRHLLRATTDQLWLVHDGRVTAFEGDLDDYAALAFASRRQTGDMRAEGEAPTRRELRKVEAQERQRLASARKPIQTRLQKVESELAKVSDQLRELDARLAQPEFYHEGDAADVAAVLKQRSELAQRVDQLEARWLALQTELDAIA
jgi:ATP-binding cassette subfamily F protein 3